MVVHSGSSFPITFNSPANFTSKYMTKPRSHRIKDHAVVIVTALCWTLLMGTAKAGFPPVITSQPTNQTVLDGGSATFQLQVSSVTTLTYQWYFQSAAIPGATNRLFTRTNAQLSDAGSYFVAVTNADGGLLSSNAILTVLQSPDVITAVSGPMNVLATSNLTYTITVTNRGSLPATNVVVDDTLPVGVNVVAVSAGGTVVGSGAGRVVFDSASDNQNSGTLTWSHNTTTATNRLLLVGVALGSSGTTLDSAVTTITYGGLNLTRVMTNRNGKVGSELWQLKNPPSGNHTINLAVDKTPTMLSAGSATLSGVDQVAPLSATNSVKASGSLSSLTVNSSTNEIVLDILASTGDEDPVFDNSQITLWADHANTTAGGSSIKPGANLVTMTSGVKDGPWADIAVSVRPMGLPGSVNWSIPFLASGAATNFTITIAAPVSGILTNIVSSVADSMDSNPANNDGSAASAQVVTSVLPVADIVTTQTGPMSVGALTNFTYTVTLSNAGPSIASGVVANDTLAPTLKYVSSSGGGTYLGGVVTWPAVDKLARNATTNFTVTVRSPTKGALTNIVWSTAASYDPSPGNNDGSASAARAITIVSPPPVDVSSAAAGSASTLNWNHTVTSGSNRVLIVGVSIDSPGVNVLTVTFGGILPMMPIGQTDGLQTKVVMYELLNPPVGKYPISVSLNTSAGVVGGAVSFSNVNQSNPIAGVVGNSGAGTNASVTIASALGGFVINTIASKSPLNAEASGETQMSEWNLAGMNYSGAGGISFGASSVSPTWMLSSATNWAMTAVALNSTTILADVGLNVTGPASVIATSNLTYSITVTNFGTAPATNVVVCDALPAGTSFVGASGGGTSTGGVVKWPALPKLSVGAGTSYTLTLRAPIIGPLTNIAYSTASTTDPDPSNNNGAGVSTRAITSVIPLADVAATVSGPTSVLATTNFTCIVTLTNAGPSPASDIRVNDLIPPGTTFAGASNGGTYDAGTVVWTLASLAAKDSTNLVVTLTAPADGRMTNIVSSTSTTIDPNPSNNDGTAPAARFVTTITPIADLATTVSGPGSVVTNASFNYVIAVSNAGPSISGSVLVKDRLPAGTVFVSASGGGTLDGSMVTWPFSGLARNAVTNFSLTVQATGVGALTNAVFSSSAVLDPDGTNNDGSSVAATVVTQVFPFLLLSGSWNGSGGFQVEFHTYPDTLVSIMASTNLWDWTELLKTNSGEGRVIFIDPDIGNYPQRFYRVQQ